ncbi:unnamed protein product [Caenorhabditis angaria]|uniref:HMG box domain-containing protein n=1 Tax=Caenorhabditis angaria TaxID=860376 RepID=A0A9P1N2S5_9PELO|nr:unnamed protein product [Caenorhabditis angaria]
MPKVTKDAQDDRIKKTKKTKDPNAPKRPLSAYFLWLNENRPRLTKPGMGVADVAKAGGAEWRLVEDKSKWEKLAQQEKAKYQKALEAYNKGSA